MTLHQVCKVCGDGPARNLPIRRHVGMVVLQNFIKLNVPLCRSHGMQTTRQYLGKTLLQGWWGFISFFVNWFVIVSDLVVLMMYRALPEPTPVPSFEVGGLRPAIGANPQAVAPAAPRPLPTGSWAKDPYLRNELRWFDGTLWTEQVANGGNVTRDEPGWR